MENEEYFDPNQDIDKFIYFKDIFNKSDNTNNLLRIYLNFQNSLPSLKRMIQYRGVLTQN